MNCARSVKKGIHAPQVDNVVQVVNTFGEEVILFNLDYETCTFDKDKNFSGLADLLLRRIEEYDDVVYMYEGELPFYSC